MTKSNANADLRAFQASFWPVLRFMALLGLVEMSILMVVMPIAPPTSFSELLHLFGVIAALVGTFVTGAIAMWLVLLMMAKRITAAGLSSRSHGWLKLTGFLSWAEMERVRPVPFTRQLGIPFLVVHSFQKGRCSLLVPLFLVHRAEFEEAVREAASPLNPLRKSLENGGEAAERTKLAA